MGCVQFIFSSLIFIHSLSLLTFLALYLFLHLPEELICFIKVRVGGGRAKVSFFLHLESLENCYETKSFEKDF